MNATKTNLLIASVLLLNIHAGAQKAKPNPVTAIKETAINDLQSGYDLYKQTALQIWNYAELGYKETNSSALLQQRLKENGFTVEAGVADIPTAFVATYGSGQPVIGILAEYDALPGLAQTSRAGKTTHCQSKRRARMRAPLVWYCQCSGGYRNQKAD
jgi:Metal-dependent amidase/aminoacylase/carboxypeptidase